MLIVCDIDMTLADARKRLQKAGKMPHRERKATFQRWLDTLQADSALLNDAPIRSMLLLVKQLGPKNKIIYLTGRSSHYRIVTEQWLKRSRAPKGPLVMRAENDWRSARDYKESAIKKLKLGGREGELIAIDDDSEGDCSSMYTKHGFVHMKVII